MGELAMLGRRSAAGPQKRVDAVEALNGLAFIMGWPGGFLELRVWPPGGGVETIWCQADHKMRSLVGTGVEPVDLTRYVVEAEARNADVLVSLPRPRRRFGTVQVVPVLYVQLEGGKSSKLLRAFRPVPTVVLREGVTTRYTAFWALSEPLRRWKDIDRANRRLAHALGAPKKHADPDNFYWAPPGSVLRRGRGKPVPIVCARLGDEFYTPREVVGGLRDAPDPDAWRDR